MDTSAEGLADDFACLAPFPAAEIAATPAQGDTQAPIPAGADAGASSSNKLPPIAPGATARGRHWSDVEPGFPFRLEFEMGRTPTKFYANMERRHNGLSRSLEKDWSWAPEKPNGDSLSHALGKLLSKDAKVDGNGIAFRDRLLGKPGMKQMSVFFSPKSSTPSASTAAFAPSTAPQLSAPPSTPSVSEPSSAQSSYQGHASASSTFANLSGIPVTPPARFQTNTGSTSRKRGLDSAEDDALGINWSQFWQWADAMSARDINLPSTGPWQGCTGFLLPGLIEPVMANYPFAYHTSTTAWTPPGPDGRVFDIRCKGRRFVNVQIDKMHVGDAPETPSCADCVKLASNRALANVLQRAADSTIARRPGMRDADLTMSQLHDRSQMHKERETLYRVTLFHKDQRIQKLGSAVQAYKQMIILLSQNNIPRLRMFMARMIKRGASIKVVNRQLLLAIEGKYTPRQEVTEDELDKAEHALILGGGAMLYALQRTAGYLCKSTVFNHRHRARFITSWDDTVHPETLEANLQNFRLALKPQFQRAIHHLMFDDVAIEPRRRVSPNDAHLRGYARENDFTGASVHFTSHDQLVGIKAMEEDRKWRLADELSVFAIGANHSTDYAISLVAASGTAKKGAKAIDTTPTIKLILLKWQTTGAEDSRGPIASIAKDGASMMNASVFRLCTEFEIDRSSTVGKALFGPDGKASLLFFDRCGRSPDKPLTDTCDDKHWGKRFRQALGRPEGIKINQVTFTKKMLSRLLVDIGYAETRVRTMFGDGEADKQNVEALTKLLLAVGNFRGKTANDFSAARAATPQFAHQLHELNILAWYAGTAFEVITMQSSDPKDKEGTFLNLNTYNKAVSRLAHLAFVLFRQNASQFVPPQHYYNTQICLRTK